jgi:hypothetical protein
MTLTLYYVDFTTTTPQFFTKAEVVGTTTVKPKDSAILGFGAQVLADMKAASKARHYQRLQLVLASDQAGLSWK